MSEIIDKKDFVPLDEPINAGIDLPDERDWHYSDIMKLKEDETGGSIETDIDKIKSLLTIFDQGEKWETQNACGEYGLRHCDNAQHLFVDGKQVNPFQGWVDYQPSRADSTRWKGTSVQGNLARFKDAGIISGYALAMSISDAKKAIDNRNFIYTGSNNGDRKSVRETGIYKLRTDGKIVGHLYCGAVGYNDDGFIAVNSYGPNNGFFTIPYDLYKTLYSRYAVFGLTEKDLILTYRAMSQFDTEYQTAKTIGITNGERENDAPTRKETAVMNLRAANYAIQEMKSYIDSKFETLLKAVTK